MPTVDWEEYDHRYNLPVGLVYIAGHYINDEKDEFSSLFHVDTVGNIMAIDPDFYSVTEPEDVVFTHFKEADDSPRPGDEEETYLIWSQDLENLLRDTNEFLMTVKNDESNPQFTTATELLEDLLVELGHLGAY